MPLGLQRAELQGLANAKSADAVLLLENGRFGNAFYLAGYAVELGLKAVIAKQMRPELIPDLSFIKAIYCHDLRKLVGLAGLSQQWQEEQKEDAAFAAYWGIAGEWSESARYVATEAYTAQLMVQAVSDPHAGILRWIRQHW